MQLGRLEAKRVDHKAHLDRILAYTAKGRARLVIGLDDAIDGELHVRAVATMVVEDQLIAIADLDRGAQERDVGCGLHPASVCLPIETHAPHGWLALDHFDPGNVSSQLDVLDRCWQNGLTWMACGAVAQRARNLETGLADAGGLAGVPFWRRPILLFEKQIRIATRVGGGLQVDHCLDLEGDALLGRAVALPQQNARTCSEGNDDDRDHQPGPAWQGTARASPDVCQSLLLVVLVPNLPIELEIHG